MSSSYLTYKLKEKADLAHKIDAAEKEFGVLCTIIRNASECKEFSTQFNVFKTVYESQLSDGAAFLQVCPPARPFERFDQEKYKIVIPIQAYFRLLDFFVHDWSLVLKRLEADYTDMKERKRWFVLTPSFSFRGMADIVYRLQLDSTNVADLDVVVTKHGDSSGKRNIRLVYTDERLGSISLPINPMITLSREYSQLMDLYEYKSMSIPFPKPQSSDGNECSNNNNSASI